MGLQLLVSFSIAAQDVLLLTRCKSTVTTCMRRCEALAATAAAHIPAQPNRSVTRDCLASFPAFKLLRCVWLEVCQRSQCRRLHAAFYSHYSHYHTECRDRFPVNVMPKPWCWCPTGAIRLQHHPNHVHLVFMNKYFDRFSDLISRTGLPGRDT
jgi:hypothetical protein